MFYSDMLIMKRPEE